LLQFTQTARDPSHVLTFQEYPSQSTETEVVVPDRSASKIIEAFDAEAQVTREGLLCWISPVVNIETLFAVLAVASTERANFTNAFQAEQPPTVVSNL
jgi:hypothetical protein